jgi:hypothetical protein
MIVLRTTSTLLLLLTAICASTGAAEPLDVSTAATVSPLDSAAKERLTFAISVIKERSGDRPKDIKYVASVATLHIRYLNLKVQERQTPDWPALEQYLQEIAAKDPIKGLQAVERTALHMLYDYRIGKGFDSTTEAYAKYKKEFDTLKARAGCPDLAEKELPEQIDNPEAIAKAKAEAKAAKSKTDKAQSTATEKAKEEPSNVSAQNK